MRNPLLLGALAVALLTSASLAQINDGDVIVSQLRNTPTTFGGDLWKYDPVANTWNSLNAQIPMAGFPNWVSMDSNNTDFMVPYVNATTFGSGFILNVTNSGTPTTVGTIPAAYLNNIDLDFDGTWVGAAGVTPSVLSFNSGTVNTLFTDASIGNTFNELTIDRDPGAPEMVVARFATTGALLFGATRSGVTTTILFGGPIGTSMSGVELWAETGQYLTCDFTAPQIHLINKNGSVATTITFTGANGAKINLDGTAWVAGGGNIGKVDLRTSTVLTMTMPVVPATRGFGPSGIEVYGSRYVTCNGTGAPGSDVNITVSSRKAADGGASYQLACSFNRRPALSIPGTSDVLSLSLDTLFTLSIGGSLPGIFQNFAGTLNPFGVAPGPVKVSIPTGLPANLNLSIFVSGVSFGTGGIQSVFNTHWFVIN